MKLEQIRKPLCEVWHFPTRALRRINQATNYSNASCLFSDANSINPIEYFKPKKTNVYPIKSK